MASRSPDRSYLIQAYMTLHSQQTHVRRRLSQDLSASSPTSCTSTSPDSAPSSPTRASSPSYSRRRSPSSLYSSTSRRSSIEPIPEEPEEEQHALLLSNDEIKLADISSRIKTTLTDLLNCEGVRNDARMRSWIATRLMDVEHELKDSKRRTSSVDMTQVGVIAASLRQ